MPERRVRGRPESPIEQRRNIPERVARQKELDRVNMRPFVQKFLPQRPEERDLRWNFDLCTRSSGEVRSSRDS
jgi:hypothetical protein